jgi:hypothetical protein
MAVLIALRRCYTARNSSNSWPNLWEGDRAATALTERAQSPVDRVNIRFRIYEVAAKMYGFASKDIHGFVEMGPMADAEIVRLKQEEGHACMR